MDALDNIIKEFFPDRALSSRKRKLIEWAFGQEIYSQVMRQSGHETGIAWVEAMLDYLQVRCETHRGDFDNIPAEGPLVVISNHPTVIDGMLLVHTVAAVRKDVKIVANHVLPMIFPQVKNITIGIQNMAGKLGLRQFREMNAHLKKGGVLIICPAGKLAGFSMKGITEYAWNSGFIQLAQRNNAALVPVHIQSRNSAKYYLTAKVWRQLSNIMVIRESFRHRGKIVRIKVGQQIGLSSFNPDEQDQTAAAARCRLHLQKIGNNQPSDLVLTIPPVARPENRSDLLRALNQCEVLKTYRDGRVVLLYQSKGESDSPVLNELGRLREISFRETGVGTGKKRDNDRYDYDYAHIILWDPRCLEIIGAYRAAPVGDLLARSGLEGIYSYSLFKYQDAALAQLAQSIEIGRGFVQQKYQKSCALDCLWQGIFQFVKKHPEYKYLMGVLTLPDSFPDALKKRIVVFYQRYFSGDASFCEAAKAYSVEDENLHDLFSGNDFPAEWEKLNRMIKEGGQTLPWPYKQMAKWYLPGGSRLLSFTEDTCFHSIAGLNVCEIAQLKPLYYRRYLAD